MYYDYVDADCPVLAGQWQTVKSPKSNQYIHKYKYVVHCKLYEKDKLLAASHWADKYCSSEWLIGINSSGFDEEADAILFKLTWGGDDF